MADNPDKNTRTREYLEARLKDVPNGTKIAWGYLNIGYLKKKDNGSYMANSFISVDIRFFQSRELGYDGVDMSKAPHSISAKVLLEVHKGSGGTYHCHLDYERLSEENPVYVGDDEIMQKLKEINQRAFEKMVQKLIETHSMSDIIGQ